MKKSIILLVIAASCLTGCSTLKTVGTGFALAGVVALAAASAYAEDNQWHNFDDYVRSNGAPTAQYTTSNGDTIYSFIKPCPYTQGFEEKIVTVNQSNRIENISTPQTCS